MNRPATEATEASTTSTFGRFRRFCRTLNQTEKERVVSSYLKLAKEARRGESPPITSHESLHGRVMDIQTVASPRKHVGAEGRKLKAAGWKPKERCGKIIWENPATGFYCSQDVALATLNREQGLPRTAEGGGKDTEGAPIA